MNSRAKTVVLFAAAALIVTGALAAAATTVRPPTPVAAAAAPPPPVAPAPATPAARVQLALLLDTSGSMSGLIDQAKSQLWRVVNEFAGIRRDGQRPVLEIALYEYGKSGLPAESGFIRRILPFTTDLDRVSEELFALRTGGGDEYCGQAIQRATGELDWSPRPGDLKLVFIAGNEPFDQGPVAPEAAVRGAAARGIVVNTVHCGDVRQGETTGWKSAALLADGRFLTIDHNRVVEHVRAPQDEEIARLGAELNRTYVPYGVAGRASQQRQAVQDSNAQNLSLGAFALRSVSKASALYDNAAWDLVDASNQGKVDLARLAPEALPSELQGLAADERQAYVAKKLEERRGIQARIRKLDDARTAFVAAARQEQAGGADTLDAAIVEVVRQQAKKSGYVRE